MTAIIQPDGKIGGLQLGPPDVLATATLITSLWNHFGGLEKLVKVFRYILGLSSLTRVRDLGFKPETLPATCHILTTNGIRLLNDADPEACFGGDPRTQLVGYTICALSHLFGPEFGVRMFMKCIAPTLLEEGVDPGVKDLLFSELTDNAHHIVQEGVFRSLPTRFEEAIKETRLPTFTPTESRTLSTDDQYIGGLLRWVVQKRRTHYLTRSADVVRVAACLKSVGWLIGPIRISSNDRPPGAYDGLTLVTSGHHVTDTLAFEDEDCPTSEGDVQHVHHYRNETAGSMLFLASGGPAELSPEKIQTDFNGIRAKMRSRLTFTWTVQRRDEDGIVPALVAMPRWQKSSKTKNSLCVGLACRFFTSKIAENVADCFDELASDAVMKEMRDFDMATDCERSEPESVRHWKIIVICIVLAIAEILGGGENYNMWAHATRIDLYRPCNYTDHTALQLLSGLFKELERGFPSGAVLRLLAICHASLPLNFGPSDNAWDGYVIGYQGNGYTVLPNLMFNMKVDPSAIGFRCENLVFANLPAHIVDGSVETTQSDDWASYATGTGEGNDQSIVPSQSSFVSEPRQQPPDVPLYINFERARPDYAPMQRQIALVGRVHGESIGVSGIYDIMVVVVQSLSKAESPCPGHASRAKALIIKASTWMSKRHKRPMDGTDQYHTYLPTEGDQAWAVFLAGQVMGIDGRVSLGCYDCTLEADKRHPTTPDFSLESEDEYPRVVIGL